jgi:hypothetical protein
MEAMAIDRPRPANEVRNPTAARLGLIVLGLPQLAIGGWAIASPRGWFDTFPGGGQHWLPAYGAFDAHLATDVGAGFVAIGAFLLLAAVWLERRLVQAAVIAYLAYAIPHFVFHLANDDVLSTAAQVANDVALAVPIVLAVALLGLTRRSSRSLAPSGYPTG